MKDVLSKLEVLALDFQATQADPEKGRLLEVGWARVSASGYRENDAAIIETYLVADSSYGEIPGRVRRITGISGDDLAAASTPAEAWSRLVAVANDIARCGRRKTCPTVIHFARFEEPYLRQLHGHFDPDSLFPFEIVCTHEITKRLFPGLPRRGLRAVAGYFGHSVAELRRCGHHVVATMVIWKKLVELLESTENIRTLDELKDWLAHTKASTRSGRIYPMDPGCRLGIPDKPGIYRILRSNGDVLYVGKARSLRKRVNSYFQKRTRHAEHILEMLTQAAAVDYTVTGSALEAAVRETDEIKRLIPPYNVALRNLDRAVSFTTTDFTDFTPAPDDRHTVGPLISEEPLRQLPFLAALLEYGLGEAGEEACTSVLGIPPEYMPDNNCFTGGFALFREKHAEALKRKPYLHALVSLGTSEWRRRRMENGTEPSESDESPDDEAPDISGDDESDQPVWTPESVVRVFESIVLRGAHVLRRARWFRLLSESSLAWSSARQSVPEKHLIVFEHGSMAYCTVLPLRESVPVPPGYKKRGCDRLRRFDIMTYDRMRVVTTELRRLVSEGRTIELRVSPDVTMNSDGIGRMLEWV